MNWTQFSGAGTFTAGSNLVLTGTQFSLDPDISVDSINVNQGSVTNVADPVNAQDAATKNYVDTELDSYLNSTEGSEGTTILYVQDYVDTAIETGDPTATPTYLAIDYNSVATQVAAASVSDQSTDFTIYEFDAQDYRSAKFLVKLANGTHTQVSEILLTLDTSDNIAITEYAIVGTNGNLGNLSATFTAADTVRLTLASTLICNVTVMGTLLV
jgi:hypothetical protein